MVAVFLKRFNYAIKVPISLVYVNNVDLDNNIKRLPVRLLSFDFVFVFRFCNYF